MLSKVGHMLEKTSTRSIRVAVVVVSIVFAELIVAGTEYLLHGSVQAESVIRAFFITLLLTGTMTKLHAIFVDRLRQIEGALRKSEAENRAILQALPDVMFQLSLDGRFLQYHAANDDLWRPPEEFINKSVYEVFPKASADQIMSCIDNAVRTQQPQEYEYELPYPDGPRHYEARLVKLNGDKVLAIVRDISAQKAAEAALCAERNSLTQRVEERTAALYAANAQLLQALQTRDEFLSSVNHELRTPLTPILAFADLLENEHYGPLNDHQKLISANIKKSAQDLLELINTILDFSDIKAGELSLEIEPFDVNTLCRASLHQIESAVRKKDLRISCTLDSAVTIIQADPRRVKQMLDHLLSNAVKFTPDGGAIGLDISGDAATCTVRFSVWDSGIGIDKAHLSQLFQPFKQIQNNPTRGYEGTGIGLALVRYLAELHDGSVAVESQLGQGSRFTILLPWNVPTTQAETEDYPEPSTAVTTPSRTSEKPLILVAEDNPMNRKVLCHMLNMAGYATIMAEDGETAVEATRQHHPGLVLMDIQMPGINGLEATRRIRADTEVSDTPIIAVTALTMPGDRERSLEAGVNQYLSKPMDMQQLLQMIDDILHSSPESETQVLNEEDPQDT
ncbi:MAG: response regulator [Anaerolineae bacterium]|nr:response regulator [Anaerolineae bacterium]